MGSVLSSQNSRDYMKSSIKEQRKKPIDVKPSYDQLNSIYRLIVNQRLFQYTSMDVCKYFSTFICCRSKKKLKGISKREFYFKRGVNKLNEDLSVIGLIRMLHNVDIMHSILFTDFEKLLLQFQRRLILHSDSEESENDRIISAKAQR